MYAVAARKHEYRFPISPEWRAAVRRELDKRPRGAMTRLAEAIGASTGQVAEMLSEDSEYSRYVGAVNKYFGWPEPTPPLASQDVQELTYLLAQIGPEGRDLLHALKAMSKEERLAYVRAITLSMKRTPTE
jgi:hypothetical protein